MYHQQQPTTADTRNPLSPLQKEAQQQQEQQNASRDSAARYRLPEGDNFRLDENSISAPRNRTFNQQQNVSALRNRQQNQVDFYSANRNRATTETDPSSVSASSRNTQHFDAVNPTFSGISEQLAKSILSGSQLLTTSTSSKKTETQLGQSTLNMSAADAEMQQQQLTRIQNLHRRLRAFFLHYSPVMTSNIDSLIRRHGHKEAQLWEKLHAKYGPFPGEQQKDKTVVIRQELVRFLRHYDPLLEAKVDDILTSFSDFHQELWDALELKYGPRTGVPGLSANKSGSFSRKMSGDLSSPQQDEKDDLDDSLLIEEGDEQQLPMDLASRLRRFFEKNDKNKLSRCDEIAMHYRFNEVELRDSLKMLYDGAEMEPPPGGFKIAQSQAEIDAINSAKKLRISHGALTKEEAEKWVVSFCTKFAPEKLAEAELIISRFEGKEQQLREALESVFGQVQIRSNQVPQEARRSEQIRKRRKEAADKAANSDEDDDASPRRVARLALQKRLERFFKTYDTRYIPKCKQMSKNFLEHEEQLFKKLIKLHGPEPATESLCQVYRERLTRLYQRFAPENLSRVNDLIEHHAGNLEGMMVLLVKKYGPEPEETTQEQIEKMEDTDLRLHAFFKFYEPSQIPNIPRICEVYKGRERDLWKSLEQLYGPTPPPPRKNRDGSLVKMYRETADEKRLREAGTMTTDLKKRLLRYFAANDPSKLNQITRFYQVFAGREDEMWETLINRYGPEPEDETDRSTVALEKSKREIRNLFEKYFEHYDPSVAYEVPDLVNEYLGNEYDARVYLANRFGPEPTYNPLTSDCRKRLILFFKYHDPPQLANVDVIAEAYIGMEDQLFELLTGQYGPEPVIGKVDRQKFRLRLLRYFRQYPDAKRYVEGRHDMGNFEHVVKKFEDFDDEFMEDLVEQFGPESPDPEAEAAARREEQRIHNAKRNLHQRLTDFFKLYDEEQIANVETLVESYFDQPEELFKLLYQNYGVETAEVKIGADGGELKEDGTNAYDSDDEEEEKHVETKKLDKDLVNRVKRMYLNYNRDQAKQAIGMLELYKDREDELLEALIAKYGPEPEADEDLGDGKRLDQAPSTIIRPISAPPSEPRRKKQDPRERVQQILERYDRAKLPQIDRMLKRYERMEDDLIALLEENYNLHPGTLVPYSQKLEVDLTDYESAQQEQLDRLREAEKLTPRQRLFRLYQYNDPSKIPQLDLLLQRYQGREEELLQSEAEAVGPEPPENEDLHHRYRLLKYYQLYNEKEINKVPAVLQRFKGQETKMFKAFIIKYGPEPADPEILPPIPEEIMEYRRSVRERVEKIYAKHAPEKIPAIPAVMQKYEGNEESLLGQLEAKYDLGGEDLARDIEKFRIYKERLTAIYAKHAPQNLAKVDEILLRYEGDEKNLFEQLAIKYPENKAAATPTDGDVDGDAFNIPSPTSATDVNSPSATAVVNTGTTADD